MKKLPKIYQAHILKNFNNNKRHCYVQTEERKEEDIFKQDNSEEDITFEEIFFGLGYSYNIPLIITTKDKKYITSLVAKTKKNVVTIDNDTIPLSEIVSIKRKKN